MPVDDLLAQPDSAKWQDFSIEFCGGTHLSNTAQAEAFALLEESAVGRGVRRITATTGANAAKAIALGAELEARVERAKGLTGEAFDAELAALKSEVPVAVVPAVVKRKLFAGVEALAAAALEAAKAGQKALLEAARAEGARLGEAAQASGAPFVVAKLEAEADSKALDAASLAFKAAAPETVRNARAQALRGCCALRGWLQLPAVARRPPWRRRVARLRCTAAAGATRLQCTCSLCWSGR